MDLQKNFFKSIYKIHVYLGLFVAVHFAIFAISGLFLLFKDDILKFSEKPEAALEMSAEMTSVDKSIQYEKILNTLKISHPTDLPLAFFPDEENSHIINSRSGLDGADKLRGSRIYKLYT